MDPDFNIKLIKQVKRFACLYDFTSPEYRNAKWKDAIWKKIAADLNTKVTWCKTRWRSLRDMYRRKKRCEEIKTCSAKPISNKKFKFAQEMSFLEGVHPPTPKDEDCTSNFSALSYKASPTKKADERVNPASDPLAVRKSTLLLFESLALKIMSASLSENDTDAIELKVASVVYEELAKLRQQKQSSDTTGRY